MADLFITKVHINKVRHLENVDIPLSETERKHLILTGINGSGKTSVLEAMRDRLYSDENTAVIIDFNKPFLKKDLICAYLSAKRKEPTLPTSIEIVEIKDKTGIMQNVNKDFLKLIIWLDYQQYGAQKNKKTEAEAHLSKWFSDFQDALRDIYGCPELVLEQDTANLAFIINIPGREPFRIQEMSAGYLALTEIYMELIMRFGDDKGFVAYDTPAIVLIDEIESHLHLELQKKALPFLTKMFPNTQFIVTTHSPFVITSIENTVVYDLDKHERLEEDMTEYDFDAMVKGYFGQSLHSDELTDSFNRYVQLNEEKDLSKENTAELIALYKKLIRIPASSPLSTAFDIYERKRKYGSVA
jgi:predicted ATP-binding protein involved in virulence